MFHSILSWPMRFLLRLYFLEWFQIHSTVVRDVIDISHISSNPTQAWSSSLSTSYSRMVQLSSKVLSLHKGPSFVWHILWVWTNVCWHVPVYITESSFSTLKVICASPSHPYLPIPSGTIHSFCFYIILPFLECWIVVTFLDQLFSASGRHLCFFHLFMSW